MKLLARLRSLFNRFTGLFAEVELNYGYLRNWCLIDWPFPHNVDMLGYTRALAHQRPPKMIALPRGVDPSPKVFGL